MCCRLISPNRRWPPTKLHGNLFSLVLWQQSGSTRLGPQCLNHARESAGKPLTMFTDTQTLPHPLCHADSSSRLRQPLSKPGEGPGQPMALKLHGTWRARLHHSITTPLYPGPRSPHGAQAPPEVWSLTLLGAKSHTQRAGHTGYWSICTLLGLLSPIQCCSNKSHAYYRIFKMLRELNNQQNWFSKQGPYRDMFRQTKTNILYYHQTPIIRGTPQGHSSGERKFYREDTCKKECQDNERYACKLYMY